MMSDGIAKRVLIFILPAVLLAGCTKENANYSARLTLLNAVPNSTGFTVEIGGNKLDSTLPYGMLQPTLQTPAATTVVQWKSNTSAGYDSSFTTDLANGTDYTLLFYDSLKKYRPYLVKDDWKQPASETKGYIRFFPMIINSRTLTLTNDTGKVLMNSQTFANFASANTAPFKQIDTFHTTLLLFSDTTLISSKEV